VSGDDHLPERVIGTRFKRWINGKILQQVHHLFYFCRMDTILWLFNTYQSISFRVRKYDRKRQKPKRAVRERAGWQSHRTLFFNFQRKRLSNVINLNIYALYWHEFGQPPSD
jgi:hypothetical protein